MLYMCAHGGSEEAVEILSLLLNLNRVMRKNPGEKLLVDGMGVASYPRSGVGPSENGTNHFSSLFSERDVIPLCPD